MATKVHMKLLNRIELAELRGKAMGKRSITFTELMQLFGHIALLEAEFDKLDCEDFMGTEGWRHHLGIE